MPWRKAVSDVWSPRARSTMVVLSIAVGICGFCTVLASYAILTRELNTGYLATNPASATLRTDRVDDELIASVLTNQDVAEAEARRVVTGRIRVAPQEWRSLVLFVIADFKRMRVSKLVPEQGAWPPATGEILIERDAMQVARAHPNDNVTIKTINGSGHSLRVSGSVHDVGQAQARMENIVYGYITTDTLASLGETTLLDRLLIRVAGDAPDRQHIRDVAQAVRTLLESRGHIVRDVDVPEPGKHPHADLMGMLLLSMAGFGFFILVLSGIMIVNLLTAILASQIRHIGVMKALGGSRSRIVLIYLGQALLLGVAALAIGVPTGLLGAHELCRVLAVLLNFDIVSFAVPLSTYLLVFGVGILVPLLAAAYPIHRGSSVSIRAALTDHGVTRNAFGQARLDRMLAATRGVSRPLLLAVRNCLRQRARTMLTLATLTAGGVFFMSALNVRGSMISTLDLLFAERKYDLSILLANPTPEEKLRPVLEKIQGIRLSEYWIASEGALLDAAPSTAAAGHVANTSPHGANSSAPANDAAIDDRFAVIALPAATTLLKLDIASGKFLQDGDIDTVVINSALSAKLGGPQVGSKISFRMGPGMTTWTIAGIANEAFSPPVAYVPKAFFDQFGNHAGQTNSIRVALEQTDEASINTVRSGIDSSLESAGVRVLSIHSNADSRVGFDQHMLMIYVFLIIVSAIIASVGGLGLSTTMSLSVLERRREMGVLRAIGATPAAIWSMVTVEAVAIGVLSWILAVLIAAPMGHAVASLLAGAMFRSKVGFYFAPTGLLLWLLVSLTLSVVASFLPAWDAARRSVREALSYE